MKVTATRTTGSVARPGSPSFLPEDPAQVLLLACGSPFPRETHTKHGSAAVLGQRPLGKSCTTFSWSGSSPAPGPPQSMGGIPSTATRIRSSSVSEPA